ncbi:hypothetical protein ACJQWK_07947 [Exserohilum turcicum]
MRRRACARTDLVELDGVELCAALAQQLLGLAAVWAVRLGEDGDGVLVDDGLDLCLGSGHCGGRGGAREEVAQEGNFGGWERCLSMSGLAMQCACGRDVREDLEGSVWIDVRGGSAVCTGD